MPASQAIIETVPLEPGVTAYQITGPTAGEVQRAITAIMDGMADGSAEFRHPRRIRAPDVRWQSRGYVRSTEHA